MKSFRPLFRNAHLATIAGNYARRTLDLQSFPVAERCFDTEPDVAVLVHSQRPSGDARAEIVMVHGLEGSSAAGYMRSMSQLALEHGFAVHRTNMRSCGGSERFAKSMYHAGLTSDTRSVVEQIAAESRRPVFLVGYSLGGNVALKLAGELGGQARKMIAGVCAVSTPIDLGACVRQMSQRQNRIYEWRFLSRLKQRIRKRAQAEPGSYPLDLLEKITSVYEFDDKITAPAFGFGTADNYYNTQSSIRFLEGIRVPTLLVQAKDDPLIPFSIFESDAVLANPMIQLVASEHGGHLGFIADRPPRFWVDRILVGWMDSQLDAAAAK